MFNQVNTLKKRSLLDGVDKEADRSMMNVRVPSSLRAYAFFLSLSPLLMPTQAES
jgi:hypothetical protein